MKPQRTCTRCSVGVLPSTAEECERCGGRSTIVPVRERALSETSWFVFITGMVLAMATGPAIVLEVIHGV